VGQDLGEFVPGIELLQLCYQAGALGCEGGKEDATDGSPINLPAWYGPVDLCNKDFIPMSNMNTIMGADAKNSDEYPIIRDALQRELALFKTRERLVLFEIEDMERKYCMTSSDFLKKFEGGIIGDDQDYFVWWSLIHGLEAVRSRIDKIRGMLIP